MRDGGSVLMPAVPGWDFGAKVPARTGAVNDGACSRTIRPRDGAQMPAAAGPAGAGLAAT
ncbi:hypothetical protein XH86_33375 [Bradyrhizobium guangdongense]|nr:hypothetical protein X265_33340 [Bradyrhizobium guangdongense]QOZ63084.1 hypothetical protein XH86_33375 [Bradyrhizobium guangdongense]